MRNILFFLLLITFALCHIDEAKREEMRQRRNKEMKYVAECLLKKDGISKELRQSIENSSDEDLMRAIHIPRLEKSDKDLIRECRKESIRAIHDDFRRMEEEKIRERHHHHHHDHPHPHPNDL